MGCPSATQAMLVARPGLGPGTQWTPADRERGRRSLDLSECPLLHELHFVLALEPGGKASSQCLAGCGAQGPHPNPLSSPASPGSLPGLDHVPSLEALETVMEDVALGLRDIGGGLRRGLGGSQGSVPCKLPTSKDPTGPALAGDRCQPRGCVSAEFREGVGRRLVRVGKAGRPRLEPRKVLSGEETIYPQL